MSSTIIPGVSDQLAYEYLMSYNDSKVKYKFSVICGTCGKKNKRFSTCHEADSYADDLHHEGFDRRHTHIYLNQVNDKAWRLSEDEILSLVVVETDDQLAMMLEMYAEKMSRPGRTESQEEYEDNASDDDLDGYDIDGWDGDAQEEEDYLQENLEVEELHGKINELEVMNSKLEYDLFEAEHQIAEVKLECLERIAQIQLELKMSKKAQRDTAMEWINSMDIFDFEKRLLSDNLPCFPIAEHDDEDFKNPMAPDRQTCIHIKKTPMTFRDVAANADNYASIYRWKLRCMSVFDFKEMAYDDFA
jgi:hypothetical protein